MIEITEEQIIDKVKSGDEDAFQELVLLYRNKAFGLCYSIVGNIEDAKDILQDAFIKVYRHIDRFRKGSSFYTWFYAILVNTARDYLRKKARWRTEFLEDVADFHISSERVILSEELKKLMEGAINQLSEKQRLCFVMKHENGIKIDEIAQILHCRPSTVKVHLFRAVRSLQKKLSPYLVTNRKG